MITQEMIEKVMLQFNKDAPGHIKLKVDRIHFVNDYYQLIICGYGREHIPYPAYLLKNDEKIKLKIGLTSMLYETRGCCPSELAINEMERLRCLLHESQPKHEEETEMKENNIADFTKGVDNFSRVFGVEIGELNEGQLISLIRSARKEKEGYTDLADVEKIRKRIEHIDEGIKVLIERLNDI